MTAKTVHPDKPPADPSATTGANADRSVAPIPAGAIPRLARWVLAHRRLVIVLWAIAFLAGGMGAGNVSKRLSFNFALPGQPGYETAKQIARVYGNGGESPS